MTAVNVLHLGWEHFASDFCPDAPEARCFVLALSVYETQRSAHVGCNVRVVELGLHLLYVGCLHCFQLLLCNGVLNGDGNKTVVIVVLDPPSDCQLCVRNFVLLYLLVFAVTAGFPVLQIVLAAADILELGELPVQCETHVHNAVRIVVCKRVCLGRNTQSVEQIADCSHLGAVVVAVEVKDSN